MTDTDLITAADSGSAPSEAVNSTSAAPSAGAGRRSGSLTSMLLPDLRALASEVGVKGTSGMRKSDLIAAIKEHRGESAGAKSAPAEKAEKAPKAAPVEQPTIDSAPEQPVQAPADQSGDAPQQNPQRRERRSAGRQSGAPDNRQDGDAGDNKDAKGNTDKAGDADSAKSGGAQQGNRNDNAGRDNSNRNENAGRNENANRGDNANRNENANRNDRNDGGGNNQNANNQNSNNQNNADDDEGRGGRRGRRFRDRRRRGERSGGGEGNQGSGGGDRDTELREDDVVQPVAGILDVLDNYAFVRTSGYLAGPNDVYVSMNMVRKNGLRRGDAVTGAVRVAREGENSGGNNPRQKFNPLVRLDTVNGGPVENAKNRPDFTKLTPLYPNQRLRLETTPDRLTTRVIDLIMPIGKGQRALIVSPPKAGKTTIMQDIANAITTNNPECHLMVVLVDERPEEVTDMTRSVKGEVIASTFDRPPSDHTQAAELAIERAKRLVEQGKDVVVLLDSITRLGRAYNNASPASGRILSGGVDSTALYPPKRFLGAARNIEHGGSLTIIATAMVETGSTGDTVIFEEFKGTGNAELKLDRKIAERRVFPAVDVNPSGTRKDELLLGADEFAVVHKLRRVLSGLDSHQAIDLLMSQLRKTKTNYEFLVQVSKTTPGGMDND
ncbi:transcription termination factor Rho [Mycolicibacterium sp. 22603]|uniref:transcription termination factor Rho n=1 Tax=Mycolicibacterium sp. 22603 TaxID=3453950 RepID=UPI003F8457D2